jgi:hypothetical protein
LLYDKRISEKKKRQWKGKEGVEWGWGTTEFYVGEHKAWPPGLGPRSRRVYS